MLLEERIQLEALLKFVFFMKARRITTQLWVDPDLVGKLTDPDPLVRWLVVHFIASKRIASADQLIGLLSDDVPEVAQAARRALIHLSRGADFGPERKDGPARTKQAIQRWREWLAMQDPGSAAGASRSRTTDPAPDPFDLDNRLIQRKKQD
jgi:hypothetical protein